MGIKQDRGTPYSVTATGSTIAVATLSGVTNQAFYVTDITASSDKATGTVVVSNGGATIWQDQVGSSTAYNISFTQPLRCTSGTYVSVTVTGTNVANANISGFIIDTT